MTGLVYFTEMRQWIKGMITDKRAITLTCFYLLLKAVRTAHSYVAERSRSQRLCTTSNQSIVIYSHSFNLF